MAEFQPCPDEHCAGVMSGDGCCTICGSSNDEFSASLELDNRLPCRDGNCLGVAGPDGNCTECGAFVGDPAEGDTAEIDLDRSRRPCPKGTCIGVIGNDGLCIECRDPIGDDAPSEDQSDRDWASDTYGRDGDEVDEADEVDDLGGEADRIPCPDGACVGIIAEDGLCTECGRSLNDVE